MVIGLAKIDDIKFCQGFVYGKQVRQSFTVGKSRRASTWLELVCAGLYGPVKTTSMKGNKYLFLLIDDYNRMPWVYFLERKRSDVCKI